MRNKWRGGGPAVNMKLQLTGGLSRQQKTEGGTRPGAQL
jgi:hypothetical protein